MKKLSNIFLIIVVALISFLSINMKISAKEVNVYVFYGDGCPHCHDAITYLDSIKDKYNLNIIKYEIWHDKENVEIAKDVANYLDINLTGVPLVIIDNTPIVGFASGNTDNTYLYHIKKASSMSFVDEVGIHLGLVKKNIQNNNDNLSINIFNKELNLKKSLILSSLLLGFIDSFKVSFLWIIILFSILLINIKDNKKGFKIGSLLVAFICVTYFLFVMFNIKVDNMLKIINILRVISALLVMTSGILGLIKVLDKLDNKESKILKIVKSKKDILIICLLIFLAIPSVLISFVNYGGVPSAILDVVKYSNKISVLLGMLYFIIFILINYLVFLVFYKIFEIIKKKDIKNNVILCITIILCIAIGIVMALYPTLLSFSFFKVSLL